MAKRKNNSEPLVTVKVEGPLARALDRIGRHLEGSLTTILEAFVSFVVGFLSGVSEIGTAVKDALLRILRHQ